jgi:hypothetical protein
MLRKTRQHLLEMWASLRTPPRLNGNLSAEVLWYKILRVARCRVQVTLSLVPEGKLVGHPNVDDTIPVAMTSGLDSP